MAHHIPLRSLTVACIAAFPVAIAIAPAALAQDGQAAKAPAARPAPAKEMTIGSEAPVPAIEAFVRGKEPAWFEPGTTYVIEFWATWCGPCRASMPHLSDLAERYAGKAVVVGISDEPLERVTDFLGTDEWKQKARYNLATDPDRSVYSDYMTAAAQSGIPCAFIVKDRTVQWIGHPMTMDEPLAKVVDGSWDPAGFKPEFEREAAEARKMMARRTAMAKARKAGDWDAIMRMMDEDIAGADADDVQAMKVQKFKLLVSDAGRPADGYALGKEILAASKDDPAVLNDMAWFVVDSAKVKERDLGFALEAAKAAVTASKGEDAAILDTMARACWESGDKEQAISWQRKAVDKASGEMAAELSETLRKYRSGDAPAKKSVLRTQDGAAPGGAGGGTKDAGVAPAPGAPAGSPGMRMRGAGAMPAIPLSPEAEKVFPALAAEGFESPEAMVAFLPKAGEGADGLLRMMRAIHCGTDGGRTALRVSASLIEDTAPVVSASIRKFGKSTRTMVPVPGSGGTYEVRKDGESAAMLVSLGADGKPVGQPTPLVKVDGKWFLDGDRVPGLAEGQGGELAMMANQVGAAMRQAFRRSAEATAKEIDAGALKSAEDANAAFSRKMQEEMLAAMTGPGAGAPAAGGPATGGAGSGTPKP